MSCSICSRLRIGNNNKHIYINFILLLSIAAAVDTISRISRNIWLPDLPVSYSHMSKFKDLNNRLSSKVVYLKYVSYVKSKPSVTSVLCLITSSIRVPNQIPSAVGFLDNFFPTGTVLSWCTCLCSNYRQYACYLVMSWALTCSQQLCWYFYEWVLVSVPKVN